MIHDMSVASMVQLLLQSDTSVKLKVEIVALFGTLAGKSPELANEVAAAGAFPLLIDLLCSPYESIALESATTLGVLARGSPTFRDLFIVLGAVPRILDLVALLSVDDLCCSNLFDVLLAFLDSVELPSARAVCLTLLRCDCETVLIGALSVLCAMRCSEELDAALVPRIAELLSIGTRAEVRFGIVQLMRCLSVRHRVQLFASGAFGSQLDLFDWPDWRARRALCVSLVAWLPDIEPFVGDELVRRLIALASDEKHAVSTQARAALTQLARVAPQRSIVKEFRILNQ